MPNTTGAGLPIPHTISRLTVPRSIIDRTLVGLRERSAHVRESACVWTGQRDDGGGLVSGVVFHHEIADDRATALSLELPEKAKFELYRRLAASKQSVLALLHTHPEDWVDLSLVDQGNQICSKVGFWSIVLPFYGCGQWSLDEIGFHVRRTRGWRRLSAHEVAANLVIANDY